jgi:hypothetical protein
MKRLKMIQINCPSWQLVHQKIIRTQQHYCPCTGDVAAVHADQYTLMPSTRPIFLGRHPVKASPSDGFAIVVDAQASSKTIASAQSEH